MDEFETTLEGKRFVTYKWQAICYLPIYNDTAGGSKGGR